jgi:long-chain acyl-CoA synthetase
MRIAEDGEVMVRSPGVFAGYWEDPERRGARRMRHTGDIGEISPDGFLTLRGRKKDMLAMPDGTKVYPEDIEAILAKDERVRDATVVGFPIGSDLKIHAVLLVDDPSQAEAIVRDANLKSGAHQQIRAQSVWPDDDFPRTHTLKVKKREVMPAGGRCRSTVGDPPQAAEAAAAASTLGTITGLVAAIANCPRPSRRPPACPRTSTWTPCSGSSCSG